MILVPPKASPAPDPQQQQNHVISIAHTDKDNLHAVLTKSSGPGLASISSLMHEQRTFSCLFPNRSLMICGLKRRSGEVDCILPIPDRYRTVGRQVEISWYFVFLISSSVLKLTQHKNF